MSVISPVTSRIARVPAVGWLLVAIVAAVVLMTWYTFTCDDDDRDWLDPQQPPVNLNVDMKATAAAVLAPVFRAPKIYQYDSLTQHPGCWVGDC